MIQGIWEENKVTINGKALRPDRSLKLKNHSPMGFSWSYAGSGPSQLALAILLELTDETTALTLYQEFKWKYIAPLIYGQGFQLDEKEILNWIGTMTSLSSPDFQE